MGTLSILVGMLIMAGATSAKMMLETEVVRMTDGIFEALKDTSIVFVLGGSGLLFAYALLKIFTKVWRQKRT